MKSNSLGELRHRIEDLTGWTFDHADKRGRMSFRVGKATDVRLTVAQAEWLLDQGADRDEPLGRHTLIHGDCIEAMRLMPDASVDAICTDPPYGIGFLGKGWDKVLPDPEVWAEALRVCKPGAHALVFGGTRTFHRLAVALEDAGWEIRDTLSWFYGTGFPKSLNVSKAIDKAARGVPQGGPDPTSPHTGRYKTQATEGRRGESDRGRGFGAGPGAFMRQAVGEKPARDQPVTPEAVRWEGWGTALKPAWEPIILARKPLPKKIDGKSGTIARNVLAHGTGGLNIDGCRIPTDDNLNGGTYSGGKRGTHPGDERTSKGAGRFGEDGRLNPEDFVQPEGRWPANVVLDPDAGAMLDAQSGLHASRFFYCAKASRSEKEAGLAALAAATGRKRGNNHPTVKPLALLRYLVRLVTPPEGLLLDPFAGSGTTIVAAEEEGFRCIGVERSDEYLPIIRGRVEHAIRQEEKRVVRD